jgi:RNA polymerase sigma-70 factor (ECF subfamily)
MTRQKGDERLSGISTLWSVFVQAHAGSAESAQAASQALMLRYCGAVQRYLLGAVRDPEVAEELGQEFALRFLRGDFRRADPARGRFRDYLRTALIHLVHDYYRARQNRPQSLAVGRGEPVAPVAVTADAEHDFLESWRAALLERTWKELAQTNPAQHATLQLHLDDSELPSAQLAERLEAQLGRPVTADWVRKTLQRARARFADLLLEEVAHSLPAATPQALRQELQELDLLKYCCPALERWET